MDPPDLFYVDSNSNDYYGHCNELKPQRPPPPPPLPQLNKSILINKNEIDDDLISLNFNTDSDYSSSNSIQYKTSNQIQKTKQSTSNSSQSLVNNIDNYIDQIMDNLMLNNNTKTNGK
jgi:hypothetical protein